MKIMNKKYLFMPLAAMLMLLAGCDYNDEYFEGMEDGVVPTDVKKVEYTLTKADYGTIADNKDNKALAENKEGEFPGITKALAGIKTKLYMTDLASSQTFFPNFIANKWYTADKNSAVKITFDKMIDAPAYLAQVEAAKSYKLKDADYAVAWEDQKVYNFTPSKPAATYLPRILKTALPNAQEGEYTTVEYSYSDNEPSGGGQQETFNKIEDAISGAIGQYNVKGYVAATYNGGFLLSDGKASILVYLNKPSNYSLGDVLTVKGTTGVNGGVKQFTQSAEVTRVSRGEEFAYPAFVAMDGAALDAYVSSPSVKPVSYTGTLKKSGIYYNVEDIDGAAVAVGSLSYPAPGAISSKLIDQRVTVTGYAVSVSSGKFVNTMLVSIAPAGTAPTTTSVGEVALAASGKYTVRGAIVGIHKSGILVSDGTGCILVYFGEDHTYAVGDVVTITGDLGTNGGLNQFGKTATITKEDDKATVKYPDAYAMTAADMDAYLNAPYIGYISYKGTLSISGNYYNVAIEGASSAIGSISYPNTGLVSPDLNGKEVIVTGYSVGRGGSKYVNTLALTVVEATQAAQRAFLASTRAVASESRYDIYQFVGNSWKQADNAAIVNPSDYREMGISTNAFSSSALPDNYLAQFMAKSFPYAQEGDANAAVYNFSSKDATTLSADEYVLTNGQWIKNTNIVTTTEQYVYDGTIWKFDPSVTVRIIKSDAFSKEFLQVVVDWVKENKGEELIDRGTAEYYYGCSAYYGNVEFSPSYWKKYYPDMSDDDITAMIKEHISEGAFVPALEHFYPDADLVSGLDVFYTVTFDVHTADGAGVYTMKYKVIGKGKFEVVPNSLHEVKD